MRTGQFRYSASGAGHVNLIDDGLERQQPDWTSPEDWGELYDLSEDPLKTRNLYRQEDLGGWSLHN